MGVVVWISECPNVVGGFATVTKNILHHLKGSQKVASVCFGANRVQKYDGYNIYPYAEPVELTLDKIERDYRDKVSAIIVHGSPWVPPYSTVLESLQKFRGNTPVIGYFVHEAVALPLDVREFFQPGKLVDAVITPTKATAKIAHVKDFFVVPHGVDTTLWRPGWKKLSRFTVSMVASNYVRKRWDLFFETIAHLQSKGLDVQGLAWVPRSGYWWIDRLIWAVEHETGQKLRIALPKPYDIAFGVGDEELAASLGATHAYLHMTMGEAWGLPIGEALALGLPTAAVDYPAIREWAGKYIHLIKPKSRYINADGLVYLLPNVDDAVQWLSGIAQDYDDAVGRVIDIQDELVEKLNWRNATEKMVDVLSKLGV